MMAPDMTNLCIHGQLRELKSESAILKGKDERLSLD